MHFFSQHIPGYQAMKVREEGHRTNALEAIPERHIEIGGQAAHNRLAVGADAAREDAHLGRVEELHRLPEEDAEKLRTQVLDEVRVEDADQEAAQPREDAVAYGQHLKAGIPESP
jgi:hypothetical protein